MVFQFFYVRRYMRWGQRGTSGGARDAYAERHFLCYSFLAVKALL